MLWKSEFKTRIVESDSPPALTGISLTGGHGQMEPGTIWIAMFDFQHIAALEVWARLLDDSFPCEQRIGFAFVTPVCERKHLAVLDQCMPVSRHRRCYLVSDAGHTLLKWSEYQLEERVLAVLVRPDGTTLRMHGLPTEDAWEVFEAEAKQLITGPVAPSAPQPAD